MGEGELALGKSIVIKEAELQFLAVIVAEEIYELSGKEMSISTGSGLNRWKNGSLNAEALSTRPSSMWVLGFINDLSVRANLPWKKGRHICLPYK